MKALCVADTDRFLNIKKKSTYFHDQHCLQTAWWYLKLNDKWWIADCFLKSINSDIKRAIWKHYLNSFNYSDNDIYQVIQFYCAKRNST